MARKKLGQILIENGLIDRNQLNSALGHQRKWGHRLGVALVSKGYISEGILIKVLGKVMGLPTMDLSVVNFESQALNMVNPQTCEINDLIPVSVKENRGKTILTLAMSDPLNVAVIGEIEFTNGCKVKPVLATNSSIKSAFRKFYRGDNIEIEPLSQTDSKAPGMMQVVRPGGFVEEVDTNVGATPNVQAPKDSAASQPPPANNQPPAATSQIPVGEETISLEPVLEVNPEAESLQKLESYFWSLMRILAKKGLISKEEFLAELKE